MLEKEIARSKLQPGIPASGLQPREGLPAQETLKQVPEPEPHCSPGNHRLPDWLEWTPAMGVSRQPSYPRHTVNCQSPDIWGNSATWERMTDRGKPDSRRNKNNEGNRREINRKKFPTSNLREIWEVISFRKQKNTRMLWKRKRLENKKESVKGKIWLPKIIITKVED